MLVNRSYDWYRKAYPELQRRFAELKDTAQCLRKRIREQDREIKKLKTENPVTQDTEMKNYLVRYRIHDDLHPTILPTEHNVSIAATCIEHAVERVTKDIVLLPGHTMRVYSVCEV